MTTAVVGRARCRDGETGTCSHCGREIKRIVYLSTGAEVGEACARKALGLAAQVDACTLWLGQANNKGEAFYRWHGGRIERRVYSARTGEGRWEPVAA